MFSLTKTYSTRHKYFIGCVFYNPISGQLVTLSPVEAVLDSLHANGVSFSVYDNVSVEPTDDR